jgi:NRPS condensation-like uncharacterized protein
MTLVHWKRKYNENSLHVQWIDGHTTLKLLVLLQNDCYEGKLIENSSEPNTTVNHLRNSDNIAEVASASTMAKIHRMQLSVSIWITIEGNQPSNQ